VEDNRDESPGAAYMRILKEYCSSGSEDALYRASLLSNEFIAAGIPPDEIVGLHTTAVQEVVKPYDPRGLVASQQMLLEVMIAYGVRYSEYAEFRLAEAKKQAEAEHSRADEATRAEQARLELLAVIGHELATPLTVARGNVSAIRRFLADNHQLSHDVSTRAVDAEVAIERLLNLREELMAASRNEVRSLELAPLNVQNAVTRAFKWAEPSAQEKGLRMVLEPTPEACHVVGDPDALQSIFGNILSNAIRYTPSGGTVTVRTRVTEQRVMVDVEDTGIGLSHEAKERLFQRFYRSPEAKQMASWGLGLGLAIASELAQSLGATVSAESEPGRGCTFTVSFPLAGDAPEEEA
jgi:two-component system, OmpR family, sensor kinase